jgi:hypothetical protein
MRKRGSGPLSRLRERARVRVSFLLLVALALAGLGQTSCDSVDTAFDCQSVCSRYRDCYDSNYNVGACRDSCRSRAENDPNVKGAADACEACIGDMSCLSATFNCGTSCSNIVP